MAPESPPGGTESGLDRALHQALIIFALLLALAEGPAQIAAVVVLLILAAQRRLTAPDWTVADLGLLIWLLAGTFGALDDESRNTSPQTLRPLMALVYVVGRIALSQARAKLLDRMLFAFLVGCALNSAYGVFQVVVFDPPLERLIIKTPRAMLQNPDGSGRLVMASGFFYNRLKLAHVGILGLGAALIHVHASLLRRDRARAGVGVALGLVTAIGVALTYRRAAPVALLGGMVALAVVTSRYRLAAAAVATSAALAIIFSTTDLGRDRLDDASMDLETRAQLFGAAIELVKDHPLFGVGHGDYRPAIAHYVPPGMEASGKWNPSSPHNTFLEVLAETGLVGFLGFAVAVASSLAGLALALRDARYSADPRTVRDRIAFTSLLAILALGLLHSVLFHAPVAMIFWLYLGLASHYLPPLWPDQPGA